jgi:hypothetical protein
MDICWIEPGLFVKSVTISWYAWSVFTKSRFTVAYTRTCAAGAMELLHSTSSVHSKLGLDSVPLTAWMRLMLASDWLTPQRLQKLVRSLVDGKVSMTMAMVWFAPVAATVVPL